MHSLRNLIESKQVYLYLLSFFFVLHGIAENTFIIPVKDLLVLVFIYLLASAGLMLLFRFFTRNTLKACLIAFILMAFYFFFGSFHDLLKSIFGNSFMARYTVVVPLCLFFITAIIIYILRSPKKLLPVARYLNSLLLVLILIDAITLTCKIIAKNNKSADQAAQPFNICDTCSKPDVFLIVPDGYAGKRELQDIFHFDNTAFESELAKRGFFFVDSSVTNYNYTPFSMASLFKMDYLQGLKGKNQNKDDRTICFTAINDNPVIRFFSSSGYTIENLSVFQFAGIPPLKSTVFHKTGTGLITAQTLFGRLDRDLRFNLITRFKWQTEIKNFTYQQLKVNETLYNKTWEKVLQPSNRPRFVYTHLEMPHYPYYFDRNGTPNPFEDLSEEKSTNLDDYLGYLQYCNTKLIQLVDHILSNTSRPPVILLMSDHGFREFAHDSVNHKYHFMNLNAMYLPQKQYKDFYRGVSTVNLFRILLNSQFGQNLPLLKDSSSFLMEK